MKTIKIPEEVYERAAALAEADNVSVEKLVSALVTERIDDWFRMQARATRGTMDAYHRVLAKVSDRPPEAVDRL
jgi:predicted CopG family antitoxin